MKKAAFLSCLLLAPPLGAFEFPLTRNQRVQKLVEQGQQRINQGEFLQAAELCAQALDLRADWAPAYLCRGEARMKNGDPDAGKDAERALTLDPKSGEAYRVLGIMAFEVGDHKGAVEDFDKALALTKLKPDEVPSIYYYRARSKMHLNDLQGALKDCERGQAVLTGFAGNYSDWSFYSLRADIQRRMGRTEDADKDERRVVDLLDQRIRRKPDQAAEYLRLRAESHTLLREYDQAAQDLGTVIAQSTGDVAGLTSRADAYISAERFGAAMEDLDKALQLDPKHLPALKLRAYARLRMNRDAEAVADLDEYLDSRPTDGAALGYRGIARLNLERFAPALEDLEKAQVLIPGDSQGLEGRKAYAYAMLGRHPEAWESSLKSLSKHPESFSAHMAKARSGVALGRCAQAAPSLDWLVERVTDSGTYVDLRASCRCALKDFTRCLADSEKAVRLSPESGLMALNLWARHMDWRVAEPVKEDLEALRKSRRLYRSALLKAPSIKAPEQTRHLKALLRLAEKVPADAVEEKAQALKEARTLSETLLKKSPKDGELRKLSARVKALLKPPKNTKLPKSRKTR